MVNQSLPEFFIITMNQNNERFFEQVHNPVKQALAVFAGVVALNLIGMAIRSVDLLDIGDRFPWMVAASFMLFFAVFNSLFSLSAKSMALYWKASIYSYLGLATASGLLAWAISSLPISAAGSYRWIYIVVTIGYLIFLSLMATIRSIVEFAQREEWNHPRIRQRPKRK